MAQTKPLSFLAYSKRRGVSAEAVRKAHSDGRLRKSVVRVNGKPKIRDPELADREWLQNTRPRADQPPARQQARAAPPADPSAIIIIDRDGYDWTGKELLDSYAGHDWLAHALVKSLLAGDQAAALVRIKAQLRAELREPKALRCGYTDDTAIYAERVLDMLVAEIEHPEAFTDDDTANPEETT